MYIQCDNAHCFASEESLLDEATNEVICLECGNPIKSLPETTKKLLKQFKQVKAHVKRSMEFECKACKTVARPLLKKAGTTTVALCVDCGERLNVSPYMIEALKAIKPETEELHANKAAMAAGPKSDRIKAEQARQKAAKVTSAGPADPVPALAPKPRPASAELPKKQAKAKK